MINVRLAALLTVDIELHIVCEYIAQRSHIIRDSDVCTDTGLQALDKAPDAFSFSCVVIAAIGSGDAGRILAVEREYRNVNAFIVAVGVDMNLLHPVAVIGTLRHLCREVHVDFVNGLCFVVCLCRIGILEIECLTVHIRAVQNVGILPCKI